MEKPVNFNALSHLSGLEKIALFAKTEESWGMAENLSYEISDYGPGFVEYHYTLKDRHINLNGTLHGGIMVALLDTAMGAAAMSLLQAGEGHTMADISTKFIRPVSSPEDVLTIRADIENAGRRTLSASATIHNSAGKLVARAIGTAMKI